MKKVLICFGTRPEVIKLAPVIKELRKITSLQAYLCSVSQHRQMLQQMLGLFGFTPDFDLEIMTANQTLDEIAARIFTRFPQVIDKVKPDLIMVQGDTATASLIAQSAYYHQIPVAHVEAGLRTYDKYAPFPEEVNRRLIGQIADLNFAPTKLAAENLLHERVSQSSIFVVGNTIVDALEDTSSFLKSYTPKFVSQLSDKYILVTAHRRENIGNPLQNICDAIVQITEANKYIQIVLPVHQNPLVRKVVQKKLSDKKNILLLPPVSYLDMVYLLSRSLLVLTDSGGLQEEAPSFGKPVLVMREVTERPEGIKQGYALLVGTDQNRIVNAVNKLLNDPASYKRRLSKTNPYGDGQAAGRISKIIKKFLR